MISKNFESVGNIVKIRQKSGYEKMLECKYAALEEKYEQLQAFVAAHLSSEPQFLEVVVFGGRQFVEATRAPRAGDVVTFAVSYTPAISTDDFYNVVPNVHGEAVIATGGQVFPIDSFTLMRRTSGMKVYAPTQASKPQKEVALV